MFARFDENLAMMTLQDIKETKCYGPMEHEIIEGEIRCNGSRLGGGGGGYNKLLVTHTFSIK